MLEPSGSPTGPRGVFKHDAMYMRFPEKLKQFGGQAFLQAIVEHFALKTGADLITLSIDDVVDLAHYYARRTQEASWI